MEEETIFETALDQIGEAINRLQDLMDEAELSELESHYCIELKMNCQEFIELCNEKIIADDIA